jgi:hypothetical protein
MQVSQSGTSSTWGASPCVAGRRHCECCIRPLQMALPCQVWFHCSRDDAHDKLHHHLGDCRVMPLQHWRGAHRQGSSRWVPLLTNGNLQLTTHKPQYGTCLNDFQGLPFRFAGQLGLQMESPLVRGGSLVLLLTWSAAEGRHRDLLSSRLATRDMCWGGAWQHAT